MINNRDYSNLNSLTTKPSPNAKSLKSTLTTYVDLKQQSQQTDNKKGING